MGTQRATREGEELGGEDAEATHMANARGKPTQPRRYHCGKALFGSITPSRMLGGAPPKPPVSCARAHGGGGGDDEGFIFHTGALAGLAALAHKRRAALRA